MKIICVDNFDRQTVSDVLITENIVSEALAQKIADLLNDNEVANTTNYYKVVADDYVLWDVSELYK